MHRCERTVAVTAVAWTSPALRSALRGPRIEACVEPGVARALKLSAASTAPKRVVVGVTAVASELASGAAFGGGRIVKDAVRPNPAFNRTRRSELLFLGGHRWRRAG